MMINAAQFPGPALWQGLMFCALPVFVYMLYGWAPRAKTFKAQGIRMRIAFASYIGFGLVLFVVILLASK